MSEEIIQYHTQGTCCQVMQVKIEDNKIIDAEFFGGCNGNLKGIGRLMQGRDVQEVIEDLRGVTCGPKPTSCPDQIAKALEAYCKENG